MRSVLNSGDVILGTTERSITHQGSRVTLYFILVYQMNDSWEIIALTGFSGAWDI